MDEEIKAQIIPIIENTKEGIAKAVEVMQRELPELCNQLLMWKRVETIMLVVIFAIIFLICLKYFFKSLHNFDVENAKSYGNEEFYIPALMALGIFIIGSVAGILTNLFIFTKIMVAPKLFLVEYVMGLMQ